MNIISDIKCDCGLKMKDHNNDLLSDHLNKQMMKNPWNEFEEECCLYCGGIGCHHCNILIEKKKRYEKI